jgi:cell envelope opacity-associated protein A
MTVNGQVIQVPNGSAIAALTVQNTLNNQQISARTQIDATLSTLSALQSGQFAAALRQQILDSVRR